MHAKLLFFYCFFFEKIPSSVCLFFFLQGATKVKALRVYEYLDGAPGIGHQCFPDLDGAPLFGHQCLAISMNQLIHVTAIIQLRTADSAKAHRGNYFHRKDGSAFNILFGNQLCSFFLF